MTQIIETQTGADSQLALILELAKSPEVDANKLEQLVKLHNQEKDRQARDEAYRALALFKQEVPVIPKMRDGAKTRGGQVAFRYSAMDDLVRFVKPYADKHGLSWTFSHEIQNNKQITICRVLHISGFTFPETTIPIPFAKPQSQLTSDIQAGGITNTYGERYALKAALGLVFTDDDTDGVLPKPDTVTQTTVDDAIKLQMERAGVTSDQLNAALTKKGVDLDGWGWEEQSDKVKGRIVSGWDKLFTSES